MSNDQWYGALEIPVLKRRTPLKRNKLMRRVSNKRAGELKVYHSILKWWLPLHPYCEMKPSCLNPATQVHHTRGRWGYWLLDTRYWKAACDSCHKEHPGPDWSIIRKEDLDVK